MLDGLGAILQGLTTHELFVKGWLNRPSQREMNLNGYIAGHLGAFHEPRILNRAEKQLCIL